MTLSPVIAVEGSLLKFGVHGHSSASCGNAPNQIEEEVLAIPFVLLGHSQARPRWRVSCFLFTRRHCPQDAHRLLTGHPSPIFKLPGHYGRQALWVGREP